MAHPHHAHRAHKVEKSRVHHIAKGYATGGAVAPSSDTGTKAKRANGGAVKRAGFNSGGAVAKHRADKRARGGRTKHKGTTINIVNAGHPSSPPMPGPMAAPPALAARPPMPAAPPPMPGAPPPGAMPIRSKGGRAYAKGGVVKGAAKSGPTWEEGVRNGTQPKDSPGKNDRKDMFRGKVVTFKTGGGVVKTFRAYGGRIESPQGVDKATKLPGGGGGAEARLAKERRAKRDYHAKSKIDS